ncbi:NAD(P)/FAD-dependent oxidoreductase [Cohaesibacter celericrescens]|uniref:NAD/FAD-binding protein n=1 Tax=Cohaesibacter celericrescens TaxID=2067669 RepID=A0A2N5XP81_9HYPH|nr:FAD-dependent oxidoreductase [Cohaesibacter celericrescens]PLW76312.1 NAD/FAD-binding protein [Cohaesibacter celericrescens]
MRIAVIGSGISGLSAAWLLSKTHHVDLFEKDNRLGGHANTQTVEVEGRAVAVDTGFIVYNEPTYPNLTALFEYLGVETAPTDMSFAVSSDNGRKEYAGSSLSALFARRLNMISPSFLMMLWDIRRFYKYARLDAAKARFQDYSLAQYLDEKNYSACFRQDHLLPMGAAIWSMPSEQMLAFPFCSFVRFCDNHGLLQVRDRPQWRTVVGGSIEYVNRMAKGISGEILLNSSITALSRKAGSVTLNMRNGDDRKYDHVILACHSDQALRLLKAGDEGATPYEVQILSDIKYQKNVAVLHRDPSLMPKRKNVWSAWNYMKSEGEAQDKLCVSYWMNALQPLNAGGDLFITLNPTHQPKQGDVYRTYIYAHPIFDREAAVAQKKIWTIQGQRRTWFCGAYMGHGFHEDGIQAGLEVAERLGGVNRPWLVSNPSGRMYFPETTELDRLEAAE